MPDPDRPFRPHDGRIVNLALHRNVDDSLDHDIVITAWSGPVRPTVTQPGPGGAERPPT